jgi:hypothetical protein
MMRARGALLAITIALSMLACESVQTTKSGAVGVELRVRRRVPAFGAPRVRFAGAEVPPALVLDVAEYDVRGAARRAGFFVHEFLLSEKSGREVVTPRTCT